MTIISEKFSGKVITVKGIYSVGAAIRFGRVRGFKGILTITYK